MCFISLISMRTYSSTAIKTDVLWLLFFNKHYYTTILHYVSIGVTPSHLGLKQFSIHHARRDFEFFCFSQALSAELTQIWLRWQGCVWPHPASNDANLVIEVGGILLQVAKTQPLPWCFRRHIAPLRPTLYLVHRGPVRVPWCILSILVMKRSLLPSHYYNVSIDTGIATFSQV